MSLVMHEWWERARSSASKLSLLACCLVAILAGLSLYPGWLFFDSAKQWEWARQIAENGAPTRLSDYLITAHWPIFDTLLKVPFYKLTGEAGLYVIAQAIFFNLGLYLVGCALIGRRSGWLLVYTLTMVLSPIAVNYSVFHSSDTIVAACALISVAMICDRTLTVRRRIGLLAVTTLLMSLVRYNALPAAFLLVLAFFWIERNALGKLRSLALGLATLALVAIGVGGMRSYERTAIMNDSSVASGIALRLLDASHETSDPVIHAITDPNVRGNPRLREPLDPSCYAHGMWCHQFAKPWRNSLNDDYLRAYFHLLVYHPVVFVKVTWHFSSYALGFAAPLEATQIGRTDINAPFPSARMVYTHRRRAFLRALHAELDALNGLAARSGAVGLLGLVAALALRNFRLVAAFIALSAGYLTPLLLLAGTNNYRYTFPVTIVAMSMVVAAVCVLLQLAPCALRKKLGAA